MHLSHFILLAFLPITALAAARHYDRRDIKLPPGAYWDGSTVVLPNDITDDPDSNDSEDKIATDSLAANDEDIEFSNMTSSTLDKRGWPSKLLAVDVRTGGPKQHVGILRKGRLYWAVYSCLQLIGHQGNGRDKGHTGREREVCHQNMAQYCQQNCVVPNIVYDFGSGTYATNAHLKEKNHAGIREVVYQFAANIYRMQLEELENCYYTDFADSRKTLMCNVLRNLIIVWPTRSGADIAARLNINVEFNGKTTNGKVKCEKNLDKIKTHFRDTAQGRISKAMNWNKDDIVLFNTCQKDKCFEVGKAYQPGEIWDEGTREWREPEGCEASEKFSNWGPN